MNDERIKNIKLSLHLKYIIAIFILLSCTIAGLALYDQDLAIKGLSAAGLLTSIVLAVIAILITLWDVAGQKNNIFDVKNSIEELRNVSGEINDLVAGIESNNTETMKVLTDYITHFQEKNELNINKFTELTERFEKIQIPEDSIDEYQNIKNEIKNMNELLKAEYDTINNKELNLKPKNLANLARVDGNDMIGIGLKNYNQEQLELLKRALKSINTGDFKKSLQNSSEHFNVDKE
ncbi:hypothetical protein BHE17_08695 [Planococcus maritimus]|uniref:hypothetical protein n=1 Tax=Planococcus maritimus TaxID=192421 RepID=UPI00084C934A|nr:hypothetical protein [Planococcus maritimus]OED32515.1 hypothetical protein BHE17_08695 [Planococcus maritimus]